MLHVESLNPTELGMCVISGTHTHARGLFALPINSPVH